MPEITDEELRGLEERAVAGERAEALQQALREFPSVNQTMLDAFQGSPEGLLTFARTVQEQVTAAAVPPVVEPPAPVPPPVAPVAPPGYHLVPIGAPPPAVVPSPSPGPGQAIVPDAAAQARQSELHNKVMAKIATRDEANELAGLDMIRGLNEVAANRRGA